MSGMTVRVPESRAEAVASVQVVEMVRHRETQLSPFADTKTY